jgi:hypothetical protein
VLKELLLTGFSLDEDTSIISLLDIASHLQPSSNEDEFVVSLEEIVVSLSGISIGELLELSPPQEMLNTAITVKMPPKIR